jgi:hypothetical protein
VQSCVSSWGGVLRARWSLVACACCCAAHGHPPPSCFLASGLSLPQAQVLAELFGGRGALLDPPRAATIKHLIAFQAYWDGHPQLYDQLCKVGAGWVERGSASCPV